MSIDWSPLQPFVDYLVIKIILMVLIMAVFGIIANFICDIIRLPKKLTSSIVGLGTLYGAWVWVKWFLE
ncbi:hypothetical protein V7101_20420 [Bacillus velezensis]|uniref:hypothetical protein n=1 Tax=Bacillus velezensis TaxID=492670 RepID=UPI002FFDEF85